VKYVHFSVQQVKYKAASHFPADQGFNLIRFCPFQHKGTQHCRGIGYHQRKGPATVLTVKHIAANHSCGVTALPSWPK